MRLTRVPLVQIENHVINLDHFVNAWVGETTEEYGSKPWKLWYYTDIDRSDEGDLFAAFIRFKTRKAALDALVKITSCTDTLMVDEEA